MSTSDKKPGRVRRALPYWVTAVLCILVYFIYAQFSHGVPSACMAWMFLYPLAAGLLLALLPSQAASLPRQLLGCGIATLTLGSFLFGVLEIAGTESAFQFIFWLVGWPLALVGGGLCVYTALRAEPK